MSAKVLTAEALLEHKSFEMMLEVVDG